MHQGMRTERKERPTQGQAPHKCPTNRRHQGTRSSPSSHAITRAVRLAAVRKGLCTLYSEKNQIELDGKQPKIR